MGEHKRVGPVVVGPIRIDVNPDIKGELVVRFKTWVGPISPARGER